MRKIVLAIGVCAMAALTIVRAQPRDVADTQASPAGRYWAQWRGRQPKLRYVAELVPLPTSEGQDSGPGQRTKDTTGEWKLTGNHALDRYLRR